MSNGETYWQAEATRIVWRDVYRQTRPAPPVMWVTALDCDDGTAFVDPDLRACVGGVTQTFRFSSATQIYLGRSGDEARDKRRLAHELAHAAFGDRVHVTGMWMPGALVDAAYAELGARTSACDPAWDCRDDRI